MNVSHAYLERCATDTRFGVSALEKVVRLGEVAGEIGQRALFEARELRADLLVQQESSDARRLSRHPVLLGKTRYAARHRERSSQLRPRSDDLLTEP